MVASDVVTRDEGQAEGLGRSLLLALGVLVATAPLSIDFYLPSFPEVQGDLHASATEVQLTLTGFLLGLSLGQFLWGPISDRFGRKRPMLVSVTVSSVAALVCVFAPNIDVLIGARWLQALAGAGAVVIGRSVIPDLFSGHRARQAISMLASVNSLAPMIAPLVGGSLAGHISWRAVLGIVFAITVIQVLCAIFIVEESLPRERRVPKVDYRHIVTVLGRPRFRWNAAMVWLTFGMSMSYISSSSFIYQSVMGTPAWLYGIGFAINAAGMVAAGIINARLARLHVPAERIMRVALICSAVAAVLLLLVVLSPLPVWLLVLPLWFAMFGTGFSNSNATALAQAATRDMQGSGSAVQGGLMFLMGALVSPIGGIAGTHTAVPFAVSMVCCSLLSLLCFVLTRRLVND